MIWETSSGYLETPQTSQEYLGAVVFQLDGVWLICIDYLHFIGLIKDRGHRGIREQKSAKCELGFRDAIK